MRQAFQVIEPLETLCRIGILNREGRIGFKDRNLVAPTRIDKYFQFTVYILLVIVFEICLLENYFNNLKIEMDLSAKPRVAFLFDELC